MSILPLTFCTAIALGMYAVPIQVTDVGYETVKGVDRQIITGQRSPLAAVDTSGHRKLEELFGGSVSVGDIAVWPVSEDLYFLDQFTTSPVTTDETRRQSFVTYRGHQYRVIAVADFTDQGGCKAYLATRHVTQDIV